MRKTGKARTEPLRGRPRELELRVAVDELVALDERRQVALVGDVEEDREAAVREDDDVELPDRQPFRAKAIGIESRLIARPRSPR